MNQKKDHPWSEYETNCLISIISDERIGKFVNSPSGSAPIIRLCKFISVQMNNHGYVRSDRSIRHKLESLKSCYFKTRGSLRRIKDRTETEEALAKVRLEVPWFDELHKIYGQSENFLQDFLRSSTSGTSGSANVAQPTSTQMLNRQQNQPGEFHPQNIAALEAQVQRLMVLFEYQRQVSVGAMIIHEKFTTMMHETNSALQNLQNMMNSRNFSAVHNLPSQPKFPDANWQQNPQHSSPQYSNYAYNLVTQQCSTPQEGSVNLNPAYPCASSWMNGSTSPVVPQQCQAQGHIKFETPPTPSNSSDSEGSTCVMPGIVNQPHNSQLNPQVPTPQSTHLTHPYVPSSIPESTQPIAHQQTSEDVKTFPQPVPSNSVSSEKSVHFMPGMVHRPQIMQPNSQAPVPPRANSSYPASSIPNHINDTSSMSTSAHPRTSSPLSTQNLLTSRNFDGTPESWSRYSPILPNSLLTSNEPLQSVEPSFPNNFE